MGGLAVPSRILDLEPGVNATRSQVEQAWRQISQRAGKSIQLEIWWQKTFIEWNDKSLEITVICAHPDEVLSESANTRTVFLVIIRELVI